MNKRIKLKVGQKLGRLTVVRYLEKGLWLFSCECGNEKKAMSAQVKGGLIRSCGCLLQEHGKRQGGKNKTHGHSKTREYSSWKNMRNRCNNKTNAAYSYYGGRGIKVCERWDDFLNFLEDMGPRPEGASIDRIDSDDHYKPENCRWSTLKEQYSNRRNHNQYTDQKVI